MSFTDDLLTRLPQTALGPAAQTLLADFFQANRAFLDGLGPDASATLWRALSASRPVPWDALVATLDQSQLLALMGQAEAALDSQITLRAAAIARLQVFISTTTDLALRLLAATLLGML